MVKKAPRRTAERTLEAPLKLFNRLGESKVSITLISAEPSISPGNLDSHYPPKDGLINTLFDRYGYPLNEPLAAADGAHGVDDAGFLLHTLFELILQYRFLYLDLNDLLSKIRRLETHFHEVLKNKARAVRSMQDTMGRAHALQIDLHKIEATSTCMVVVLTYWLSFECVRDPRRALEPKSASTARNRGSHHVMNCSYPTLKPASGLIYSI